MALTALDTLKRIVSDFILLQFYHSLFTEPEENKERTVNIMEAIKRNLQENFNAHGQLIDIGLTFKILAIPARVPRGHMQ